MIYNQDIAFVDYQKPSICAKVKIMWMKYWVEMIYAHCSINSDVLINALAIYSNEHQNTDYLIRQTLGRTFPDSFALHHQAIFYTKN